MILYFNEDVLIIVSNIYFLFEMYSRLMMSKYNFELWSKLYNTLYALYTIYYTLEFTSMNIQHNIYYKILKVDFQIVSRFNKSEF